jgi:hypothetical protein
MLSRIPPGAPWPQPWSLYIEHPYVRETQELTEKY